MRVEAEAQARPLLVIENLPEPRDREGPEGCRDPNFIGWYSAGSSGLRRNRPVLSTCMETAKAGRIPRNTGEPSPLTVRPLARDRRAGTTGQQQSQDAGWESVNPGVSTAQSRLHGRSQNRQNKTERKHGPMETAFISVSISSSSSFLYLLKCLECAQKTCTLENNHC